MIPERWTSLKKYRLHTTYKYQDKKKKMCSSWAPKPYWALKEIKGRETRNMERGQIPVIKKRDIRGLQHSNEKHWSRKLSAC